MPPHSSAAGGSPAPLHVIVGRGKSLPAQSPNGDRIKPTPNELSAHIWQSRHHRQLTWHQFSQSGEVLFSQVSLSSFFRESPSPFNAQLNG